MTNRTLIKHLSGSLQTINKIKKALFTRNSSELFLEEENFNYSFITLN